MLRENQLRQKIDRAAARRDTDHFALELLDGFDISRTDEIELRL